VLLKNRKPLQAEEDGERRKKWWSLEQKVYYERNFDHVNHATVQQFVVDNPRATILHLGSCTNTTLMTVECIAHTWRGEKLNISRCNLEGMSSTASCCVLFLECDLPGWLLTGQLPSFAQHVQLKTFFCSGNQFTGKLLSSVVVVYIVVVACAFSKLFVVPTY
jgi:hypothetical protein